MGVREDLEDMKRELEEVKQDTFMLEILHDYKNQNKRFFVVWLITFIALIGIGCYTVYLLNDIGVETSTTEEVIDVENVKTIESSHIHN